MLNIEWKFVSTPGPNPIKLFVCVNAHFFPFFAFKLGHFIANMFQTLKLTNSKKWKKWKKWKTKKIKKIKVKPNSNITKKIGKQRKAKFGRFDSWIKSYEICQKKCLTKQWYFLQWCIFLITRQSRLLHKITSFVIF